MIDYILKSLILLYSTDVIDSALHAFLCTMSSVIYAYCYAGMFKDVNQKFVLIRHFAYVQCLHNINGIYLTVLECSKGVYDIVYVM